MHQYDFGALPTFIILLVYAQREVYCNFKQNKVQLSNKKLHTFTVQFSVPILSPFG